MKSTSDTFFKEPTLQLKRWYWMLLPLLFVAITFYIYYPSLSYAFEFDDLANIEKLFAVRHTTLQSIFFKNSRWISYWLNALYYSLLPQSAKFSPFMYRLGNVIFHCATGFVLFFMVKLASLQATRHKFFHYYGTLVAALTSALFLLHPVQTQTVSYVIQGQLEGLAGFFIVAVITCFLALCYVRSSAARWLLTAALFFLAIIGCGSKEIIIVCPLLVLLVDWFFVAQGDWHAIKQRRWLHILLFVIVIALYVYLLKPQFFLNVLGFNSALPNNIGNVLTEHKYQNITPYYFFISQFKVILHYLWIFIYPLTMSVDYDWKLSRHVLAPDALIPLLVLLAGGIYIIRRLVRNKIDLFAFGILWFFIAILPRSSIIPSTELLADYKTYSASIGLFFIAALGFAHLLIWVRQKYAVRTSDTRYAVGALSVSMLLLLLVGWGAAVRNKVWSSPEAFWLDVIKHAPAKARAYNNYGVYLCETQQHQPAIEYFKRAIELDHYYADPLNNIAVSYAETGQIDLAIDALKQSQRLMPYHPEIYNNLANLYMKKNDHDQVEPLLNTALKLRPHYGKAYYNLGNFYVKINELEKAFESFKNGCTKADFDNATGFAAFGRISMHLKRYDDALWAFSKLLAVAPDALEPRINLAAIAAIKHEYPRAQLLYKEVIARDPQNVGAHFEYAGVLYQLGNYQEAATEYAIVKQMQPNYVPLYLPLAESLAKLGRKQEAIEVLRTVLAQPLPGDLLQKCKQLLQTLER